MPRGALQTKLIRAQAQPFCDWWSDLREIAGERWHDVAEQAPTAFALWGGGATPEQAIHMVGLILPPKAP